jgi:hypothetical protein
MRQIHFAPGGIAKIGCLRTGYVTLIECPVGIQDDFCPTGPETNGSLGAYHNDHKTDQHFCQDSVFHQRTSLAVYVCFNRPRGSYEF